MVRCEKELYDLKSSSIRIELGRNYINLLTVFGTFTRCRHMANHCSRVDFILTDFSAKSAKL